MTMQPDMESVKMTSQFDESPQQREKRARERAIASLLRNCNNISCIPRNSETNSSNNNKIEVFVTSQSDESPQEKEKRACLCV